MASTSSSSSRRSKPTDSNSIGNFFVDQEIGKGSFATVYSGRHKTTGALVAIKAVELARLNKKLKDNLYGEIKILKSLRHPHIVALHDCIESKSHINLIMEYCELGDLSLFIRKREKLITNPATHDLARKYPNSPSSGLNEVVIRHFLKQLASALKFLREGNFVHRDIKPQNLLLLPSPQFREVSKTVKHVLSASHDSLTPAAGLLSMPMLKLADFGFARVLPSTSLAETLCGSPLYMAPEILRYERYDAKADLWSVGTVLYEMVTGRPPFKASNHVELLRKIEHTEDQIKFPRESIVSNDLKNLTRALLRRNPVERASFDYFFTHPVVVDTIPGLVEDDIPKEERRISKEIRTAMRTDEVQPPARRSSFRRYPGTDIDGREGGVPLSPKPRRSSPLATPIEAPNPFEQPIPRTSISNSPGREFGDGLGTRRPTVQPSSSAPARPPPYNERRRGLSNASLKATIRETPPTSSPMEEYAKGQSRRSGSRGMSAEQEKAAQDVAFERDYVLVDKKLVEINSFADQMAAGKMPAQKPGQIVKRATQQGPPTSNTGAISSSPSRNMKITTTGRDHYRQGSYDKALSSSPGSATAVISKAIQDASLRLFGYRYTLPNPLGKGHSPPQIYNPFPAYPTPAAPAGLISDGKHSTPLDEESRVAQCIEDLATRSDVAYGFAEVKYKQLVPLAPSMQYGLGGISAEKMADDDDNGLTAEAKVALSEEALVLYVKSLALLAKSFDIASLWWSRKTRTEMNAGHLASREASNSHRINSAVQWIRGRFNEVLEKAEIVRLKLIEAQKQLPEDHPSHPSNQPGQTKDLTSASGSSADGVFLTPGVTAEKLMYDRALEMSRAAAINEIASEDLAGCELSYITAIRMLEAVLDCEDDLPTRKSSGASKDESVGERDEISGEINSEDQESVRKVIHMVMNRLVTVRSKMQRIAAASKAQAQQESQKQQQALAVKRRSGDLTPRTAPAS